MNQDPSALLTVITTVSIAAVSAATYLAYRAHERIARRTATPAVITVPPDATDHPPLVVGAPDVAYNNYRLLIARCNDPLMWYANMVGKEVLYLGTWKDDGLHKSREPMGFINIVRPTDAIIIRRVP